MLYGNKEVLGKVLEIVDFGNLVNLGDETSTTENQMEMSFYALLALINISHDNKANQKIIGDELEGIRIILTQLRNPVYEAKKTGCFCLSNLVKGNEENGRKLAYELKGVTVLVDLINNEEDDELSNKAYEVITYYKISVS